MNHQDAIVNDGAERKPPVDTVNVLQEFLGIVLGEVQATGSNCIALLQEVKHVNNTLTLYF